MAKDKKPDLKYEADPNFEGIEIDEPSRGNSFIGIRRIRWQPDAEFKIDLRRYVIRTDNQEEYPSKGISMEEEVADKVTEGMVDLGYGRTKELLESISTRSDFEKGIKDMQVQGEAKQFAKDFLDSILDAENVEIKEF